MSSDLSIRVSSSGVYNYNSFLVSCRELDPGTVSLTGDWAQGDDSKHYSHYNGLLNNHKQNITSLSLLVGTAVQCF